jgi:hypothetical protein
MAPLHQHHNNVMSNEPTDKQSTESGVAIGKPAVMRRSFLRVVREWFTGRTELVPYNYGQPDCPRLKVGDRLIIVSQNEGIDYVAMSCRMSDTRYMRKGKHTQWKVTKVYDDGAALCECGKNRMIDKYLSWDDGNRVTANAVLFLHSELRWRVYFRLPHNGHCLTLARAFGGLATSCSWPPFFSLQALGKKQ